MDSLYQIGEEIKACQRCELRMNATQPVPGIGDIGSKYFLIGEAPGKNEDEVGVPFVGLAGKRLDKLLTLAGISLNECYLSNVCRCRPLANRAPKKKEIKACVPFLWKEIRLVKPQYIVTLGSVPLSLFCPYRIRQVHGTLLTIEVPDDDNF